MSKPILFPHDERCTSTYHSDGCRYRKIEGAFEAMREAIKQSAYEWQIWEAITPSCMDQLKTALALADKMSR